MKAERFEEICENLKNTEHCVVATINKNDECYLYLNSGELEMRCMLSGIVKELEDDDMAWLLRVILLELNKRKGEENNEQQ